MAPPPAVLLLGRCRPMRPDGKPSRTTTKRFVWANILAAWGTLWAALAWAPSALEWIATPVLLLIVGIFGFYTGTGTADMFATLRAQPHRQAGRDYGAWSVPASTVDDEREAG